MKIFGRDPALWISVISQLIILAGTFGLHWLTGPQAALWVVAINAVAGAATAYTVRPISPVAFTYLVGSILALAAAYGLNLPVETVAAINAAVVPILALLARGQVAPQLTRISRS